MNLSFIRMSLLFRVTLCHRWRPDRWRPGPSRWFCREEHPPRGQVLSDCSWRCRCEFYNTVFYFCLFSSVLAPRWIRSASRRSFEDLGGFVGEHEAHESKQLEVVYISYFSFSTHCHSKPLMFINLFPGSQHSGLTASLRKV